MTSKQDLPKSREAVIRPVLSQGYDRSHQSLTSKDFSKNSDVKFLTWVGPKAGFLKGIREEDYQVSREQSTMLTMTLRCKFEIESWSLSRECMCIPASYALDLNTYDRLK
jgi:hypothetical protein